MRVLRVVVLSSCVLAGLASPARADVTVFLGTASAPSTHQARGVAIGGGILAFGFEFEYSNMREDAEEGVPSLKTGMGNVLLQTPVAFMGFQPYFTTGGGIYQEELATHSDTGVGFNTGGGVKVSLAGPIRLRVDYRVFKLGSGALNSPAHRFYAGVNLKF
jgi:opacity protein-like surface antigen